MGVLVSIFIIKAGVELIKSSVDSMLGVRVQSDLAKSIKQEISRNITKRISKKFGIVLHTIGVYSINTQDPEVIAAREKTESIVFAHKEVLQLHGFYLDTQAKTINFDIIISFKAKDRKEVYKDTYRAMRAEFKGYKINITLDLDLSD